MAAGRLRNRVVIQSKTLTTDAYGAQSETWADVRTVWAQVSPLRVREALSGQEVVAETTHRVTMRYDAADDVTESHRLMLGARVFTIEGPPINVDERNRTLELMVRERS